MTLDLLQNHPLRFAFEEFSLADRAYRRMVEIGVGDFSEYEKAWREFLHRIERVWAKTQAAVHSMPNWQKGDKVELSWQAWDRPLLPVMNRGVVYDPPKTHLGQSIEHLKRKGKAGAENSS